MNAPRFGRKLFIVCVALASLAAVSLTVVNEKHREANVIGKWYRLSPLKGPSEGDAPIVLLKGGRLDDGDVSSTWSYFNGEVTMGPQGGSDTVYVLSEDGKRLTGKVVKDSVYEKRP